MREHFIHVRLLSTGAYLKHDLLYNRAAVQQFATVKLPDKFQREPTVTMTLSFKDRSLKVRHKCSIMQICFHFEAYLCRNAKQDQSQSHYMFKTQTAKQSLHAGLGFSFLPFSQLFSNRIFVAMNSTNSWLNYYSLTSFSPAFSFDLFFYCSFF